MDLTQPFIIFDGFLYFIGAYLVLLIGSLIFGNIGIDLQNIIFVFLVTLLFVSKTFQEHKLLRNVVDYQFLCVVLCFLCFLLFGWDGQKTSKFL